MRKIKKINGFLVVKFNDREKREYEGTALGEYGVIDAEVYTGNLDIDRGAMEYDDADTLEVAVELARGLESEEDITDEPPEEKGPSDEQTAPCGGCPLQGKKRELIQLGRLLKEVGEYVNSSPSRTSQSR